MITQAPLDDPENAPGGRAALARGCVCSVLANAAHRAGGGDEPPLIEPGCPVHTRDPHPSGPAGDGPPEPTDATAATDATDVNDAVDPADAADVNDDAAVTADLPRREHRD